VPTMPTGHGGMDAEVGAGGPLDDAWDDTELA